jgi:hypothetical protein
MGGEYDVAVRSDFHTDELIDAIDDWQVGSKDKGRLIKAFGHLPASYRIVPTEVFRQLRANAPWPWASPSMLCRTSSPRGRRHSR